MAVFVPPGFWQFIMSLNDEDSKQMEQIVAATRVINQATPGSPGLMRMDPVLKPASSAPAKKKRRVSKYQREFGRQLKKLKAKHPRTPVTRLMKRAHAATKRIMRKR